MGIFSILSLIFGWEADALFLTALLTVIGFSVQDTIVVFDRIRENTAESTAARRSTQIADRSLHGDAAPLAGHAVERHVYHGVRCCSSAARRSKQFVAVMFIGLISGTYSSIFNAVPILVGGKTRTCWG